AGGIRQRQRGTAAVDESAPRAPVPVEVDEVRAHVLTEEGHHRERRGWDGQREDAPGRAARWRAQDDDLEAALERELHAVTVGGEGAAGDRERAGPGVRITRLEHERVRPRAVAGVGAVAGLRRPEGGALVVVVAERDADSRWRRGTLANLPRGAVGGGVGAEADAGIARTDLGRVRAAALHAGAADAAGGAVATARGGGADLAAGAIRAGGEVVARAVPLELRDALTRADRGVRVVALLAELREVVAAHRRRRVRERRHAERGRLLGFELQDAELVVVGRDVRGRVGHLAGGASRLVTQQVTEGVLDAPAVLVDRRAQFPDADQV